MEYEFTLVFKWRCLWLMYTCQVFLIDMRRPEPLELAMLPRLLNWTVPAGAHAHVRTAPQCHDIVDDSRAWRLAAIAQCGCQLCGLLARHDMLPPDSGNHGCDCEQCRAQKYCH